MNVLLRSLARHRTTTATVALVCLTVFMLSACTSESADDERAPDSAEITATVVTLAAREGTLVAEQTAYGTVIPAPGASRSLSVPFESHIRAVYVTAGQQVGAGTPLISLEPSADACVQMEQARTTFMTEQAKLQAVQQRFDLHLATREDLATQQQAVENAQARYNSFSEWADIGTLSASAVGTVDSVLVSEGALLPAGTPLIKIITGNRFEVRLGIEPERAPALHTGQEVVLYPLYRPGATTLRGTIRSVSQKINPNTRLVDVLVTPHAGAVLLLDEYLRGQLDIPSARGIIVPRSSVLPEEDRYVIFTVAGGQAHRHIVAVDIETDGEVLISGDISAGDSVVVLGNYELADGMRVQTDTSRFARPVDATPTIPLTGSDSLQ